MLMMAKKVKQKILFVSHLATMSGAPFLLLEIIKEFKKKCNLPFKILLIKEGPIANEFKLLAKTYVWSNEKTITSLSVFSWLGNLFLKAFTFFRQQYILFCLRGTSLVFFNTITNGQVQKKLLSPQRKFIRYVHELGAAIHIVTNKNDLDIIVKNTNLFIACSNAVKNNLVDNVKIDESTVKVFNTPITEVLREKKNYIEFINSFKTKNNVTAGAVIIGVAATNEWRKGFDLFPLLITIYFNLFPDSNAYFVWKGFSENNTTSFFDLYDFSKHSNNKKAVLLPHGSDSIDTIACFDIHLLLSREDPYPLVVLEAASFGIPTVCFANAGGTPEFIEDDCGYCVPYGDLIKMAYRLNELVVNNKLRSDMGLSAQKKLSIKHIYENTMPAFMDILNVV
jgi:glycosyltransferase involved in cell wall biosynthesis